MGKEASVGGILGELFSLLGDTARDFALYTLVIGGLTAAGTLAGLTETAAGGVAYGFQLDGDDSPASAAFELFSAAVSMFGTYLLVTRFLAARGRMGAGGTRFWHYLGMSILSFIAVILGLILLIVPGIYLLVRWSAASGFAVGARDGVTASLSASWDATKGHGWAIFLAALIVFFGVAICHGVATAIFALAGGEAGNVAAAFVEGAAGGVFAALGIAVYCRVRDDAGEISEVFA
jgi:hypothetical protein